MSLGQIDRYGVSKYADQGSDGLGGVEDYQICWNQDFCIMCNKTSVLKDEIYC